MLNTRAKGQRTFQKAVRWAMQYYGTVVIPIYQVSRWAQAQPFDMILFRPTFWPRVVEVRTTQWGVAKTQTKALSALPGEGYHKQIWRFRDHAISPDIRQWHGTAWVIQQHAWGET